MHAILLHNSFKFVLSLSIIVGAFLDLSVSEHSLLWSKVMSFVVLEGIEVAGGDGPRAEFSLTKLLIML